MTVSHQLVLVLQGVLEQGPYDGLQFRVGGQQVGAEYLEPRVGQAVHYRESVLFQKLSRETLTSISALIKNVGTVERHLTFLIEEAEGVGLWEALAGRLGRSLRRLRGRLRAGRGRRLGWQYTNVRTRGGQISERMEKHKH